MRHVPGNRLCPTRLTILIAALTLAGAAGADAAPSGAKDATSTSTSTSPWLGEDLPLPLAVRTPADLAVKGVAERQYLIFNLLTAGKLAWDAGKFSVAAEKWETLLRLPRLDAELDQVIRPLAALARARGGGTAPSLPPPTPPAPAPASAPSAQTGSVTGTVSGGGTLGPGGAVVWLKRTDGKTPHATPARNKVVHQVNKTFVPRVLAVTVGTKVDFKNQDDLFHNVFSLSRPNDFDAGLYKGGDSYTRTFSAPGPVQILCNIHASMIGYVVVVDTPYYGQADASGAFSIRGVPAGEYESSAWHEGSSKVAHSKVVVAADGARGVVLHVAGDRNRPTLIPDKYGKPRQAQLGY